MKKRNLIFGGLAGLLFMAFTAVNVTVSQSYQGEKGVAQFTLLDLVANADGGAECVANDSGECAVSCGTNGPCCVGNTPHCKSYDGPLPYIACNGQIIFC